ncbi:MAG TPA: IS1595 family transposase [Caulobacteraceae bacterium]|nr:IS1595 family transposase [Caulobacteraceae bacterium]
MFKTFKTLPELFAAFPTEQSAIDHFTAIRWSSGAFCPLCGNADAKRIGTLTGTNTHKCYVCRKRFSIRVGTIFQDTKLPLRTWYAAIWMLTNHPKGIASTTLATDLGVTQKTAWFLLHRIRHAQRTRSFNAPLKGEVEADETAVGGKGKNMHRRQRRNLGTGFQGKSIVLGMVERGGELRTQVIPDVTGKTLQAAVRANVQPGATLYTDAWAGYRALGADYAHESVDHSRDEWVRGAAHTNTIESVWALLKRQIIGIHHWVSPKHLPRYVGEMTYRVNRRDVPRGERINNLLAQTEGPMPYKVLTA